MTTRLLPSLTVAAAVAAALACASPASAATVRHATPGGTGSLCSATLPCTLQKAIDDAPSESEIVVHGGTHAVDGAGLAGQNQKSGLYVRAAGGEARPVVDNTGQSCAIAVGAGSVVEGLHVRLPNVAATAVCPKGDSTVQRMVITGTGQQAHGVSASDAHGALIRGVSIKLTGEGSRGMYLAQASGASVRNVSVQAEENGIWMTASPDEGPASIRSTYASAGGDDLRASCESRSMSLDVTSSAFEELDAVGDECTFNQSANRGTAGADVSQDASGVLRPGPTSPLLDAGTADAHTGSSDVEGDPRRLGSAVDIGADERRVAPSISSTASSLVTATSARLSAFTSGRGAGYAVSFELGTTPAYGRQVAATTPTSSAKLPPLVITPNRADLAGLTPGTTYHFRAKATNVFGQTSVGPDRVFTTAPAPSAPGGPASGTGDGGPIGSASGEADTTAPRCTLKVRRARKRGRSIVRGRCSEAGVLRISAKRGRKVRVIAKVRIKKAGRVKRTIRTGKLRAGKRLTITVRDAAGNRAPKLRVKLRRR